SAQSPSRRIFGVPGLPAKLEVSGEPTRPEPTSYPPSTNPRATHGGAFPRGRRRLTTRGNEVTVPMEIVLSPRGVGGETPCRIPAGSGRERARRDRRAGRRSDHAGTREGPLVSGRTGGQDLRAGHRRGDPVRPRVDRPAQIHGRPSRGDLHRV